MTKICFCVLFMIQAFAFSAMATVDSIGRFSFVYASAEATPIENITYQDYQTSLQMGYSAIRSYCIGKGMFFDGVSSSAYPIFKFMTEPYEVKTYGFFDGTQSLDINVLSHPRLEVIFDFDSTSNYVETAGEYLYSPSFVVDVSAFPRSNSTERLVALTYAKLAIIGLFENLKDSHGGRFAAEIQVLGLPSQVGLVTPEFTRVHATTNYKYSYASPVVAQYKQELLGEYCP